MAAAIFEWLDFGRDFQDRIANACQPVTSVALGEKFGFDHSSVIGDSQKFHRFARDLFMDAVFHNQSTGGHNLAAIFSELGHGTITLPGNIRKKVQRMAARGKIEQLGFRLQTFEPAWFPQWKSRGKVESRG